MRRFLNKFIKRQHNKLENASNETDVENSSDASGVRGDSPILLPEHDAFGINSFARAIARSICDADASDGLVYAINGAWGSGKSSAINLILHYLSEPIGEGRIVPASFNPWWFSGTEALTVSFFQEMRATVGKSLDEKARETLAGLGNRLSAAGPLLGGIASLLATPAAGAAVAGGAVLLEKLTKLDSTVEKEHRKLARALAAQDKKFLIILDDIDRLSTDDALQIFKLVKSAGRLPNVIYLMAFDRHLAETMVAERFPAEGISYLEKVIQGAFDLPIPDSDDLRNQLLKIVENVMGEPPEEKLQRFWNIFYDAVAPLLKTPRDTVRLSNVIKVSWPAVGDNVDLADFLAMETMRLFLPSVHQAVRTHPDLLTGTQKERSDSRQTLEVEYNTIFLDELSPRQREIAKRALRRLFPRLDAIWSNTWHSNDGQWQRNRFICAPEHFQTYFAFGVVNDGITIAESDALVDSAGIPGATSSALLGFVAASRRKGGTRAALALEELTIRAGDIAEADVGQFVKDVFNVADELDSEADRGRGFSNITRLHWLFNNLLRDRFELPIRTQIIRDAAMGASLDWLISLSDRCKSNKDKRSSDDDHGNENLVDDEAAEWLYDLSRERLREAATDGSLAKKPGIEALLYRWRDRVDGKEVRKWTDVQLTKDDFVVTLAKDVISEMLSQGIGGFGSLGDRVARRSQYVHLEPLSPLLDIQRFKERINSMLEASDTNPSDRAALERFKATPERDPNRTI